MINVIASGSKGNAIIYHNEILVDVGVAYIHVEPFLDNIKYILLTHRHTDHYNISTITNISVKYPDIIILGHNEMIDLLDKVGISNTQVIECNTWYQLEGYQIASFELQHDVKNIGYRIFKELPDFEFHKTIHATDTFSLEGIEALDYDLYCIEYNHCQELIEQAIEDKVARGVYAYEMNAKHNHMSDQRADEWLKVNNTMDSKVIPLHISDSNGTKKRVDDNGKTKES